MSLARTSEVRRLHFESSTMVIAHLKTQVLSESHDGIRKFAIAEKQARFIAQQNRLRGVEGLGQDRQCLGFPCNTGIFSQA